MKKWVQDLILGSILLLFSVTSFVYAYIMQDASAKYFLARADTYILLWTGILGILSAALVIRSVRSRPAGTASKIVTKRVGITVLIIASYIALLDILGFVISSTLFLAVLLTFFTIETKGTMVRGKALVREIAICSTITLITVAVVFYLFGVLLGVRLPSGSW